MNTAIDIIVPTYNRPDDLKKYIDEIDKQVFENVTIWIIDDHGQCDIKRLIPEHKKYSYIRLPENKGQAYARNIPLASGKGDIVISMDDDAWFDDDNQALQKITGYFEEYQDLGCLMFNVSTPLTGFKDNYERGEEIPLHVTCGCAYRRHVLEQIGGFSGFLHSQAEETDISLKIIATDFKIRFAPDVKVFHNFNPNARSLKWYRYMRHNTARNDLLIVVMRYPLKLVPVYLAGKYINHLRFDIKNKKYQIALYLSLSILLGFVMRLPQAIRLRRPVSMEKFNYWRKLF